MSEIQSLVLRVRDLNQSVDWWNAAMIWSLVFVAIAAVAVVITTRVALVKAKRLADTQAELIKAKDGQLALDLVDKDVKIAQAGRDAAKANRGAAEANERATKAQESLALAEQHAAEANTKAEGFRLDIAKANETAERERLARLQLEARLANRHLTPKQGATLAHTLRLFTGTRYNIFVIGGDGEIVGIADDIFKALSGNDSAGWIPTVGFGQDSAILDSGVLVQVDLDTDAATSRAAKLLIDTLNDLGIATKGPLPPTRGAIMGNVSHDPTAKIRIVIAKKPL